jgi:hypothetical protein
MYSGPYMSPKTRFNFMIDPEQREALRRIKEREGIAESEQVRRAINGWLERKGEKQKTERKRVVARTRS